MTHRNMETTVTGEGDGPEVRVELVAVDVDGLAAPGLVVAAGVLVDALVAGPHVRGHVGAVRGGLAVPGGVVDDVRLCHRPAGADQVGNVAERFVDAGGVTPGVQFAVPGAEVGDDLAAAAAVCLHVVDERGAGGQPEAGRLGGGVVCRGCALGSGVVRVDGSVP